VLLRMPTCWLSDGQTRAPDVLESCSVIEDLAVEARTETCRLAPITAVTLELGSYRAIDAVNTAWTGTVTSGGGRAYVADAVNLYALPDGAHEALVATLSPGETTANFPVVWSSRLIIRPVRPKAGELQPHTDLRVRSDGQVVENGRPRPARHRRDVTVEVSEWPGTVAAVTELTPRFQGSIVRLSTESSLSLSRRVIALGSSVWLLIACAARLLRRWRVAQLAAVSLPALLALAGVVQVGLLLMSLIPILGLAFLGAAASAGSGTLTALPASALAVAIVWGRLRGGTRRVLAAGLTMTLAVSVAAVSLAAIVGDGRVVVPPEEANSQPRQVSAAATPEDVVDAALALLRSSSKSQLKRACGLLTRKRSQCQPMYVPGSQPSRLVYEEGSSAVVSYDVATPEPAYVRLTRTAAGWALDQLPSAKTSACLGSQIRAGAIESRC
jgi:hypothetical protein